MKFTLSWLKDHLKTKATVEEIATKLSAIGLEVESVTDPAEKLGAFRIRAHRRSQEASQRRQAAGELQVEVEKGGALHEVVCGAPERAPECSPCSRRSAPTSRAPRSRSRRSPCAAWSRTA